MLAHLRIKASASQMGGEWSNNLNQFINNQFIDASEKFKLSI